MIGVDPDTGKTVTGLAALACRFQKILTTQVTSRIKRRGFGNRAVERLGKNQTPNEAMIVQNLSIEALTNPVNGVIDYEVKRCQAVMGTNGFKIRVHGQWQGQPFETSVML
ncbi:phage baseplate protein [Vibrio sp. JC009]|uniref:phage baseplate protein n=1 Tax=Vibrio sp. JC009 TaxID=2912314 RepID=UPI0023AE6EAA|nr:phage baseplate protein [Vibrio sp. JC009]WED23076.1 phage baseplate protein [Vibrio sp. JC009]